MSRAYRYVAIIGSRDATMDRVKLAFGLVDPRTDVIVSGGARGADAFAKQLALQRGFHYIDVPAVWNRGKGAGFARNTVIADVADHVIAVWDGESRGTADTIEKARRAGRTVEVIW